MYEPEQSPDNSTSYAASAITLAADGIRLRDGRIYTWDAVRSVEVRRCRSDRMWWRRNFPIGFLLVMLLGLTIGFVIYMVSADDVWGITFGSMTALFVILAFAFIHRRTTFPLRHLYLLRVHGTFGAASILASLDNDFITMVADTIRKKLADEAEARRFTRFVPPAHLLAPMPSGPQQVLWEDDDVYITDRVVRFGSSVYDVGDIKKISNEEITVEPLANVTESLTYSLFPIYFLLKAPISPLHDEPWLLISILAMVGLVLWLIERGRKRKHAYLIRLEGTFGKAVVFATLEKEYATHLTNLIYVAIHERRQMKLKAQEAS